MQCYADPLLRWSMASSAVLLADVSEYEFTAAARKHRNVWLNNSLLATPSREALRLHLNYFACTLKLLNWQ